MRRLHREGEREAAYLIEVARGRIEKEELAEIQYIELCDADTLEPLERIEGPAVMALAVFFEGTRLIDNTLLEPE